MCNYVCLTFELFLTDIYTYIYFSYDIYLDNEYILQNVEFLPASINDLLIHHNFNQTVTNLNA